MKNKIGFLIVCLFFFASLTLRPLADELIELVRTLTNLEENMLQRWLILGAGTSTDIPLWHEYAKNHNATWQGINTEPDPQCKNCFKIDFNRFKALDDKLPNNYYDLIFFDKSTIDAVSWYERHIQVLANKLKPGGKLLIEIDPNKVASVIYNVSEFSNYNDYKRWYEKELTDHNLGNVELTGSVLPLTPLGPRPLIGQNFLSFTFPRHKDPDNTKFFSQVINEVIIPFNEAIFKKYFDVEIKEDNQYPQVYSTQPNAQEKKFQYYSLTKR